MSGSKVYVNIWNTGPKTVGHASVQFDDSYFSHWPGKFSAVGPFKFMPQKAAQGNYPEDLLNSGENPQKKPDLSIELSHLDVSAMKREAASMIKSDTKYQLFPMWGLAPMIKNMTSSALGYLSADPFSGAFFPFEFSVTKSLRKMAQETRIENCTTSAAAILKAGGMDITPKYTCPWGLMPQALGKSILEQGGNQIDE